MAEAKRILAAKAGGVDDREGYRGGWSGGSDGNKGKIMSILTRQDSCTGGGEVEQIMFSPTPALLASNTPERSSLPRRSCGPCDEATSSHIMCIAPNVVLE